MRLLFSIYKGERVNIMNGSIVTTFFFMTLLMCGALAIVINPDVLSAKGCTAISVQLDQETGMEQVYMNAC